MGPRAPARVEIGGGRVSADAPALVGLEDARAQMLAGLAPLPPAEVALADALRRVLADGPVSRLTLPPWDNSAMDGFAVRAADVIGASPETPVGLRVIGEVQAGHEPAGSVVPGSAVRILTGAPLPDGADAVVPVENTDGPSGATDSAAAQRGGLQLRGGGRPRSPGGQ